MVKRYKPETYMYRYVHLRLFRHILKPYKLPYRTPCNILMGLFPLLKPCKPVYQI